MSKEVLLTIEKFHDGGEAQFLILSPKEIRLTLRAVAQKKSSLILYYDNQQQFLKTVLLAVVDHGIWVDVGPNSNVNDTILHSENLTFVTKHQGAKVQFECLHPSMDNYAAHPAFHFPLPEHILRLQRREYFRLTTSAEAPLKCVIPPPTEAYIPPHEVTILDISIGGIAISCSEQNIRLEAGTIYHNCRIDLPEIGTLNVSIEVINLFEVTSPGGKIIKHAGCMFVQLDRNMSILLQRYVDTMQSKILV